MFGEFRKIEGLSGASVEATAIPVPLLQDLSLKQAIPVTIGGTSNRTFTLNASVTNPVPIWTGKEFIYRKSTKTYSWVVGSNVVIDSDGTLGTQTNGALGIWYMYIGVEADGDVVLYPSQSAPSAVEGPYESGVYAHPGTARPNAWTYVGFMLCDATTPTFVTMTKVGKVYMIKESEKLEQATSGTSYSTAGFTGAEALPAHEGVMVGGYVETGSAGTVHLAYDSDGAGTQQWIGATGDVQNFAFGPFPLNAGTIYEKYTTAAGDIHVTQIWDVV